MFRCFSIVAFLSMFPGIPKGNSSRNVKCIYILGDDHISLLEG